MIALIEFLRRFTHGTAQSTSGGDLPRPLLDAEFYEHGTDPQWTADQVARAMEGQGQ